MVVVLVDVVEDVVTVAVVVGRGATVVGIMVAVVVGAAVVLLVASIHFLATASSEVMATLDGS